MPNVPIAQIWEALQLRKVRLSEQTVLLGQFEGVVGDNVVVNDVLKLPKFLSNIIHRFTQHIFLKLYGFVHFFQFGLQVLDQRDGRKLAQAQDTNLLAEDLRIIRVVRGLARLLFNLFTWLSLRLLITRCHIRFLFWFSCTITWFWLFLLGIVFWIQIGTAAIFFDYMLRAFIWAFLIILKFDLI